MRLPRYSTVLEIPPTCASASNTTGVMSDRRKSSSAAVNPAGPAPAMTAIFCGLSDEFMRSNQAAIVEIPILPCSGPLMPNPRKADVCGRNDEAERRVRTHLAQVRRSERSCSGICFPFAHGGGTKTGHDFPVGIHERQQHRRAALHL